MSTEPLQTLLEMASGTSKDVTAIASAVARLESMVAQLLNQTPAPAAPTNQTISLLELIDTHYEYQAKNGRNKRGKPICRNTLKTYKVNRGFVKNYLHYINQPTAPASVLNNDFAREYELYNLDRLAATSARMAVSFLAGISRFGVEKKFLSADNRITYKPAVAESVPPAPLTQDELLKLESARFRRIRQGAVDCFLFLVYTGFHYIDGALIDSNAQQVTPDGFTYLQINRQKTGETAIVPYTEKARALVDKYGGLDKLPFKTNNTMNYHLKMAAKELGLGREITMSIGRDTFADDVTNNRGISDESLAAMLGHSGTGYVRKYRKVKVSRVAKEWKSE
ncbi:hypothetical protein F5984_18775 [Rudanella paleaurantiibacter]|uniref:Tyrosine-type recombinase/integrase n=1 Tax=Rudanella paleaurantiibacter TaxID=2614655 RepID=A0A7J5TVV5_9BACT|nr:hypothetical protein [Rudanella paleaurantiibacter]KAB7728416.1 hypothetical protein F5984_18775 [Rudanella paleaurantiibacter]